MLVLPKFPRWVLPGLLIGLTVLPSVALAQRGMGMRRPAPGAGRGGNPVAPLIDMRRELNLSSRQLMQLDSIERSLLQGNREVQERLRSRMDSLRPERPGRALTEDERAQMRASMRARMDSLRPLREQIARNDSTARARAMAVLTDSQRVRVREWQAEQRGFQRGLAARRGETGPRQGFRGRQPGARRQMMPPAPTPGMRGRGVQPGFREDPMPRRRPPAEAMTGPAR